MVPGFKRSKARRNLLAKNCGSPHCFSASSASILQGSSQNFCLSPQKGLPAAAHKSTTNAQTLLPSTLPPEHGKSKSVKVCAIRPLCRRLCCYLAAMTTMCCSRDASVRLTCHAVFQVSTALHQANWRGRARLHGPHLQPHPTFQQLPLHYAATNSCYTVVGWCVVLGEGLRILGRPIRAMHTVHGSSMCMYSVHLCAAEGRCRTERERTGSRGRPSVPSRRCIQQMGGPWGMSMVFLIQAITQGCWCARNVTLQEKHKRSFPCTRCTRTQALQQQAARTLGRPRRKHSASKSGLALLLIDLLISQQDKNKVP